MDGVGIYRLGKAIADFGEQELTEFSDADYDYIFERYGIGRTLSNEIFYSPTDKSYLGHTATAAVVAALDGVVYKIYFNFIHSSTRELEDFRNAASGHLVKVYGKPAEVRDLPNGMRLTIWDCTFGNLILEYGTSHTAFFFTSNIVRSLPEKSKWKIALVSTVQGLFSKIVGAGGKPKRETLRDEEKSAFADAIAKLLQIQLVMTAGHTMDFEAGGPKPKPKAIGYVYGYVDAVLRTKGWDMAESEIGPPITFQVIHRLWPGKEREYFDFLAEHLSDPVVGAGMLHGGQQYLDSLKPENSENVQMGLARYVLTES